MIKRFFNWITGRTEIARLREANDRLRLETERQAFSMQRMQITTEEAVRKYQELRAQVMQIRVSQSTLKRAGWEVMCFIPEEILEGIEKDAEGNFIRETFLSSLVKRATTQLVDLAIRGIVRVRENGKCCALVFEPLNINGPARAPKFVQALWDKGGEFKLSEKCWDRRSEEQRVRNAAGCQ